MLEYNSTPRVLVALAQEKLLDYIDIGNKNINFFFIRLHLYQKTLNEGEYLTVFGESRT